MKETIMSQDKAVEVISTVVNAQTDKILALSVLFVVILAIIMAFVMLKIFGKRSAVDGENDTQTLDIFGRLVALNQSQADSLRTSVNHLSTIKSDLNKWGQEMATISGRINSLAEGQATYNKRLEDLDKKFDQLFRERKQGDK